MTVILAIDPGDEHSAAVQFDTRRRSVDDWRIEDNCELRRYLEQPELSEMQLAIEYTPPYTMPMAGGRSFVPNQVALTAIEVGRFVQLWEDHQGPSWSLVSRIDVKKHLLGRANGNDAQITQAILDRYGGTRRKAVGVKADPGPLFGVKKDVWAALAVAITFCETTVIADW